MDTTKKGDQTKQVIIADDHAIFREGIRARINKIDNYKVIGEAKDGREAIFLCREHKPDLIVLDLVMPITTGHDALKRIKVISPETKILISTSNIDLIEAHALLADGAHGYFVKHSGSEEFILAVQTVVSGGAYLPSSLLSDLVTAATRTRTGGNMFGLTSREVDLLLAIVNADNNKEVARKFKISVRTVETHLQNIKKKTEVKNREDLTKIADHLRITMS